MTISYAHFLTRYSYSELIGPLYVCLCVREKKIHITDYNCEWVLFLSIVQLEGVKFLLRNKGRALLADEMGLGKSLQAITTTVCLSAFPCLIIAPASLRIPWFQIQQNKSFILLQM